MKKILLLIIFVSTLNNLYSWDTTAAKYFPLQIGNTWVYRGSRTSYLMNGSSYQVYKVAGILDTLGKRYYSISVRIVMISGTLSPGVWQLTNLVRIDSISMIVCKPESICQQIEFKIDSLKSKLRDSLIVCRYQFYNGNSTCTDTSSYFIFNQNFPSKKFNEFYGPGFTTVYVKNIGIVYHTYGYQMNWSHDSLRGCIINGVLYGDTSTLVGINKISSEVPEKFFLSQNYPNPFNPTTKIRFAAPLDSRLVKRRFAGRGNDKVVLKLYDVLGREIQTLVNEELSPGIYEVDFDGSDLPSGVYYYTLTTGDYSQTKKMVLIK